MSDTNSASSAVNPPASLPAKRRGPFAIVMALIAAILLFVLAYFIHAYLTQADETDPIAEIRAVPAPVAPVEDSALPNPTQSSLQPSSDFDDLQSGVVEAHLKDIEARLSVLSAQDASREQRLIDLSRRLEAAEEALKRPDAHRLLVLAGAAIALQNAVFAGRPFESELRFVEALIPENLSQTRLDMLRVYARTGIKRLPQLSAEFISVSRGIMSVHPQESHKNWFDKLKGRLASLVSIRPLNENKAKSVPAIVTRMQVRLDRNDLPAVLEESRALKGPAAAAAATWLSDVRAHVAAQDALAQLSSDIARDLSLMEKIP